MKRMEDIMYIFLQKMSQWKSEDRGELMSARIAVKLNSVCFFCWFYNGQIKWMNDIGSIYMKFNRNFTSLVALFYNSWDLVTLKLCFHLENMSQLHAIPKQTNNNNYWINFISTTTSLAATSKFEKQQLKIWKKKNYEMIFLLGSPNKVLQ